MEKDSRSVERKGKRVNDKKREIKIRKGKEKKHERKLSKNYMTRSEKRTLGHKDRGMLTQNVQNDGEIEERIGRVRGKRSAAGSRRKSEKP